ncbi:MAG TPA: nucleoside-diphosphate sugar epimerase/dehydratase [Mycobacteriales bacterium]|nr:nucleoside-diphosphate sugar epimerase/dehydratase [Mycobacteriales bacterium]
MVDAIAWVAAMCLAAGARYDFAVSDVHRAGLVGMTVLGVVLHLLLGRVLVYRGRYRYGSYDELTALAAVAFGVGTLQLFVVLLAPGRRPLPGSVPYVAAALAFVFMIAFRWLDRRVADRRRRTDAEGHRRALVFGAGDGGRMVVQAMLRDAQRAFVPVGLLDDHPRKKFLRLDGVRVLGGRADLAEVAARTRADLLVIAVPSADAPLVRELSAAAQDASLAVKVLPPTRDMFDSTGALAGLRDVRLADLIGRHQISTDMAGIAGYLTGRRVMVTGAGGSIGSELCRQIASFAPEALIMLDRDESSLQAVQLSLDGRGLLDDDNVVLADLRDGKRMDTALATSRPDVVFHAAALKHLPLLEAYPGEAVLTNVLGTQTLLDACARHGVERFVHVSTDKAADPISVLGYSKRVAERLTAQAGRRHGLPYMSVRFGNVLGSRGSVLGTFAQQVEAGGPVTVTDPRATRYFMSIPEAVELVVQAGAIGSAGEVLVLDMGAPVTVGELAERVMGLAGRRVEMVVTGMRPGEKLVEDRLGAAEVDRRPVHPLITHVDAPPLDVAAAHAIDPTGPAETVIAQLRECAIRPGTLVLDPEPAVAATAGTARQDGPWR